MHISRDLGGAAPRPTESHLMWTRDFRSPGEAFALFQIYDRFAPLTPFCGFVWRYQVDEPISLQCYLLEGDQEQSIIHCRRGPSVPVLPPLFQVVGQADCAHLDPTQLEAWVEQGTVVWLRQLGSPTVSGVLRYSLFTGMCRLDREKYPAVFSALKELPLIPLRNGDWMGLDELQEHATVFFVRGEPVAGLPGWWQSSPVVLAEGQYAAFRDLLPSHVDVQEIQPEVLRPLPKEFPRHIGPMHRVIFESYLPNTKLGLVRIGLRKSQDKVCQWTLRRANELCATYSKPLFEHVHFRWDIHVYLDADRAIDESLDSDIRDLVIQNLTQFVQTLRGTEEFFRILCLALEPRPGEWYSTNALPGWVWRCRYRELRRLSELREDRANLDGFADDHPLRLLQALVRRTRP